jgi:hypothetical protein
MMAVMVATVMLDIAHSRLGLRRKRQTVGLNALSSRRRWLGFTLSELLLLLSAQLVLRDLLLLKLIEISLSSIRAAG